jgi:hypothetical protein
MNRDRICIFLTVFTGIRMDRQHKDVNRVSEVHSLFRTGEY